MCGVLKVRPVLHFCGSSAMQVSRSHKPFVHSSLIALGSFPVGNTTAISFMLLLLKERLGLASAGGDLTRAATFNALCEWNAIRQLPWRPVVMTLLIPILSVAGYVASYFLMDLGLSMAVVNMMACVAVLVPPCAYGVVAKGEPLTFLKATATVMIVVGCSMMGFKAGDVEVGSGCLFPAEQQSGSGSWDGSASSGGAWPCGDLHVGEVESDGGSIEGTGTMNRTVQLILWATALIIVVGINTCTFTFAPKLIPTEVQFTLLIFTGALFTLFLTGILMLGEQMFHPSAFLLAVMGTVLMHGVGSFAYFRLARGGTEGSHLAPLTILYTLVPVIVSASMGEPMGRLAGYGVGIVAAAAVALSHEMVAKKQPANQKNIIESTHTRFRVAASATAGYPLNEDAGVTEV
jgi:hypothetical protein